MARPSPLSIAASPHSLFPGRFGLVGTAPGGRHGGEEEEVLELVIQGVT